MKSQIFGERNEADHIATISFLNGFCNQKNGKKEAFAWFLSSLVIPAIILFDEFVLPYRGGGASFWTIAIVIGGFYGVISGGLGVVAASFYLKKKGNTQHSAADGRG